MSTDSSILLASKESVKPKIASVKTMLQFITSYDILILTIGLLGVIIFSLSPLLVVIQCGNVIEAVEESPTDSNAFYEEEREFAILNFILAGITILAGWTSVICFIKFGSRQGLFWKEAYFKAIASQPIKWFDRNNPAGLGSSIDIECDIIEHALGEKIMLVTSSIIFFIAAWILAFTVSIELTLISLTELPLFALSEYLLQSASVAMAIERQKKYRTAGGIAEESLEGVKTIASCNGQEQVSKKYQKELEPLQRITETMGIYNGIGWGILFSGFFIYTGLLTYIGAYYVENDSDMWNGEEMNASAIFLVYFATAISTFFLSTNFPCLESIRNGLVMGGKIDDFIKTRQKFDGSLKPNTLKGSVTFENVYFNYPANKEVNILQGLSFHLEPGMSLAVVGETGSGKSTIAQLVEGFYYCSEGIVKIDGIDIRKYDLSELRKFISIVNQEPVLFNQTIEENIKIGNKNATEFEVKSFAMIAEADNFIECLPSKYKTWVGVKGSLLSGGQKQRIALARALIKKPKILLLDEATSALDATTENAIQVKIEEIMKEMTTITIAQRISTIKNSGQIIVISQGKVVEQGTYTELVAANSYFKTMLYTEKEITDSTEHHVSISSKSVGEKLAWHKEEQVKTPIKVFRKVLETLEDHWTLLSISLFSALIAGASIPIFSYLLADSTNIIMKLEGEDIIADTQKNFIILIIDAVGMLAGMIIMCWSMARVTAFIAYKLRFQGLYSLLCYDQKFYDDPKSAPSLLTFHLENDCEKVSELGGPILGLQLLMFTSLFITVLICLLHDVILGLIAACFLPLFVFSVIKGERLNKGIANHNLKKTTEITSDTFMNIKTVQSFNAQQYFYDAYVEATLKETENTMGPANVVGFAFGSRYGLLFVIWGTISWYGAYRVTHGESDVTDLMIIILLIVFNYLGSVILGGLAPDIKAGVRSGKKLFKMIEYKPEINLNSTEGSMSPIAGSIKFQKVDFEYEGRDIIVLKSVSFSLHAGKRLGITGTTGSGKSTIAQLLLRFYNPTGGEILIDSIPISAYNVRHLRESITWVGQEPILFSGSILSNLQLACIEITEDEAIKALGKAQALDIIEKYGIQSDVGVRGCRLSGGQKQRIAIARALVRKPKILIFDEATSALDTVTEEKLMQSIQGEDFTIISIAHRLQSIKDFENILVLEKGVVIESGDHKKLMEMPNGIYHRLYEKSD